MKKPGTSSYVLRVVLAEISPPIWRDFTVPSDIGLGRLHLVIQAVMGWQNFHLHEFHHGSTRYAPVGPGVKNENDYILRQLLTRPRDHFTYLYDFGDCWHHVVTLKAVRPIRCTTPRVLDGKRACPPEDCGGPGRFKYARRAVAVSDLEEDFDDDAGDQLALRRPDVFNVTDVNMILDKMVEGKRL